MKKIMFLALICCFLLPVYAQAAPTNDELFDEEDDLNLGETVNIKKSATDETISGFLAQNVTAATIVPLNKAEKVFCYTVDYAEKGYNGYTVDGLAVTGYCGELSKEGISLIRDSLLNNSLAFSKSRADCQIRPKILLRYVYGIDHTDILLSSPCHSVILFHHTDIALINATPGATIVEQIANSYSSLREEFRSPALLGQMVGSGVPQTQAQKNIIRRNEPNNAPLKKWNNEENKNEPLPQAEKSGWNKLQ